MRKLTYATRQTQNTVELALQLKWEGKLEEALLVLDKMTRDQLKYIDDTFAAFQRLREEFRDETIDALVGGPFVSNDPHHYKWPVPPWPYKQMAIIFRKMKRFDAEIAILESYLSLPTLNNNVRVIEDWAVIRLRKAKKLIAKQGAGRRQRRFNTETRIETASSAKQ